MSTIFIPHRIGNYLRRHWNGECSLTLSFWVNFLLLFCVLNYLEIFTLPPYLHGERMVIASVISFFVMARLVIYPWQVVGVIRACERSMKNRTDRTWAIIAEGVVVLSFAVTLVATFSNYQSLLAYRNSLRPLAISTTAHAYSLNLIQHDTLIHLRGQLDIGIVAAVAELLAKHPQVSGIILDSGGGQIYQGRGLARLIRENKLTTYSLNKCASACTTAFIAGTTRTLSDQAKLGFHQYKNETVLPLIDIEAEQNKDRAWFRAQGISPAFLRKMFDRPPDKMWWPEVDELLNAGVVHKIAPFSVISH